MKSKSKSKITAGKKNYALIVAAVAILAIAAIAYAIFSNPADKKTMTLKEARAKIDAEYSKKGEGTNTPPVMDNYIPILSPRAADRLPSYAYTNPTIGRAYRYAAAHPEVLEQIPCYCGCGGHADHRFLRDCFIRDDGTYDNHASFCDVCIGEAIKLQDYLKGGVEPPKAAKPGTINLFALSLPDNFRSLSDG